ncbi:MAG: AhpC/TSA family protein [Prevotella sp.]|nr:AhpC/TSA family protein [Prevotella sp.]
MKKIFSMALMALFSLAASAQQNGYTVTGSCYGTEDGDSVFLCSMQGFFSMVPEDTCIVRNGKYEFKGNMDGATLRFICPIHKGESVGMADFILENSPIVVNILKPADAKSNPTPEVHGGPTWTLYNSYEARQKEIWGDDDHLFQKANDTTLTQETRRKYQHQLDSITNETHKHTYHFIMAHISEPVADYLYGGHERSLTKEQREEILDAMGKCPQQYQVYKGIMAERKAEAATAIGQKYIDFTMPNPKGKNISISDFVGKNKYVLVDFWASWCGPCRKEMPNVVKAYNLYHKKGFEVIGVSFDNNRNAWIKAIPQLKMPWPQMSDVKGWESAASSLYNIKAIPANVLIDKDGKIVAKNLREEELLQTLEKLM